MRNYLARLGWGHGDDELFSDEEAIAWFDVRDVVRAPARLDWAKLNHINNHYIRRADDGRLTDLVTEDLGTRAFDLPIRRPSIRLLATIPMVKEGAKTIRELSDLSVFALKQRPVALDVKGLTLLDRRGARPAHARLTAALASQDDWAPAQLTSALRDFAAPAKAWASESSARRCVRCCPEDRPLRTSRAHSRLWGRQRVWVGSKMLFRSRDEAL